MVFEVDVATITEVGVTAEIDNGQAGESTPVYVMRPV